MLWIIVQLSLIWPQKLTVIELNDDGICFDAESALRLSEFKAEVEKI